MILKLNPEGGFSAGLLDYTVPGVPIKLDTE